MPSSIALYVGENYEVEASVGPAKGLPKDGGHGLWLSKFRWSGTHWDALVFGPMKKDQFYVGARRWRYRTEWSQKIKRQEPHLVNLECHENFWQVSVDGKKLSDKEIKMDGHHNGELTRLALGGYVDPDKNTKVEYQSVRVRKLDQKEKK